MARRFIVMLTQPMKLPWVGGGLADRLLFDGEEDDVFGRWITVIGFAEPGQEIQGIGPGFRLRLFGMAVQGMVEILESAWEETPVQ